MNECCSHYFRSSSSNDNGDGHCRRSFRNSIWANTQLL